MNPHPSVIAVVVTHNRPVELERTLSAIAAQTRPVRETIVLDNASGPATSRMLRQVFPGVTHIRLPKNAGAAGGFHAGMKRALIGGHDWMWLFSDDCWPDVTALEELLGAGLRGDLQVGILATWLRSVEGRSVHRGAAWRHRTRQLPRQVPGSLTPVDVLTFLGILVRSSLVSQIGLPRAEFFMGMYETEFCLRARDAGAGISVLAEPLMNSLDAENPRYLAPPWRGYYHTRNSIRMALDRGSLRDTATCVLYHVRLLAAYLVKGERRWQRIGFRTLGAWHAFRGISGATVVPTEVARSQPSESAASTDPATYTPTGLSEGRKS